MCVRRRSDPASREKRRKDFLHASVSPPETHLKRLNSVQGLWRRRRRRRQAGGGGGGGEGNEAAGAFPPHQGRNEEEVNC